MKRVFALFLSLTLFVLLFAGCTKVPQKPSFDEATTKKVTKPTTTAPIKEDPVTVRLVAEKGPAAIGMVYFFDSIDNKKSVGNYEYELLDDAKDIGEKFAAGELDVAAVSIKDALEIYKENKGKVQVVAITSLSNLYLVELGEVSTKISDFEDFTGTFYAGKDTLAGSIMSYIFKASDLDVTINAQYADKSVADLASKGRILHGVLPEPLATLSTVNAEKENVGMDVADLWEGAVSNTEYAGSKICSSCIIASTDFVKEHPNAVKTIVTEVKSSVKNVNSQTTAPDLLIKYELATTADEAKAVIPGSSLICKDGDNVKSLLGGFLDALYNFDKESIPVLPDDDFYYVGK
ncbi:MAG: hypothetical protein KBS43_02415 [Oscillospiraceae bacterium]|nr:hypothetical protein [Candidatus Limimonas coprohippi]